MSQDAKSTSTNPSTFLSSTYSTLTDLASLISQTLSKGLRDPLTYQAAASTLLIGTLWNHMPAFPNSAFSLVDDKVTLVYDPLQTAEFSATLGKMTLGAAMYGLGDAALRSVKKAWWDHQEADGEGEGEGIKIRSKDVDGVAAQAKGA